MTTATPAEVADLGAEETALAAPERGPLQPALAPMSSDDVLRQVRLIQEVMGKAMKEGEHYGVIPGTDKPSLLKSGAEKLSLTFRLRPKFGLERLDLAGEHREYVVTCDLYNTTGGHEGQGIGSCSTMESKYRWRQAKRQCPNCGAEAIIRGKAEYGGGWLCWKKQNGCGAKFAATAPEIVAQVADRIENPDLADTFNTVLKMAKKRAMVDATLTATAASDLFTQDLEDLPHAPKTRAPHDQPIAYATAPGYAPTAFRFLPPLPLTLPVVDVPAQARHIAEHDDLQRDDLPGEVGPEPVPAQPTGTLRAMLVRGFKAKAATEAPHAFGRNPHGFGRVVVAMIDPRRARHAVAIEGAITGVERVLAHASKTGDRLRRDLQWRPPRCGSPRCGSPCRLLSADTRQTARCCAFSWPRPRRRTPHSLPR